MLTWIVMKMLLFSLADGRTDIERRIFKNGKESEMCIIKM